MLQVLFENEVMQCYAFWTAILVLKLLAMAALTGVFRFKNMSFANPEDAKHWPNAKVTLGDEQVERVRRSHLNDLENVIPLIIMGFVYVLTNPDPSVAKNLIRIATVFRILHTMVYAVVVIPQPARFIAFIVPSLITTYMACQVIITLL